MWAESIFEAHLGQSDAENQNFLKSWIPKVSENAQTKLQQVGSLLYTISSSTIYKSRWVKYVSANLWCLFNL